MKKSPIQSKKLSPFLERVVYEIRYAYGHTYLDRCGQTLIDIEQSMPQWMAAEPTAASGQLQDHTNGFIANFGPTKFDFTANSAYLKKVEQIGTSAHAIWDIIRNNLGLSSFIRVGCRFRFLLAKRSFDEAENCLSKSEFNVSLPKGLGAYRPIVRQPIMVVKSEHDIEYRLEMQVVPKQLTGSNLPFTAAHPRLLTKNQRQAQSVLQKQGAFMGIGSPGDNLPYVILLDIDCAQYESLNTNPRTYIEEQYAICMRDFVPYLRNL